MTGVLILGESGTGKSTAIRTLPPESTFIIKTIEKSLPFPGAKKLYTPLSDDFKTGNSRVQDDSHKIINLLNFINHNRPDIKHIVIDDFGYMSSNSFMRQASVKGYEKFTTIGKEMFDVLNCIESLRDDLICFVMMHVEIDQNGRYKPKTVGKMVDQHICVEGKFTYIFHALTSERKYKFLTNNDGQHMAKTPMGMFDEMLIDNDLLLIADAIRRYE